MVKRYSIESKKDWDSFVKVSKNGTFLHHRDFTEYHANRFTDCSLMIFSGEKLVALLPANLSKNTLFSHQGLTYGGLILLEDVKIQNVLDYFDEILLFLKTNKINSLVYKCIPSFYHNIASNEDEYAMFINKAKLIRRDTSFVIDLKQTVAIQQRRKRSLKKAIKLGLNIEKSHNFDSFWDSVLIPNLKTRFGVLPVHSLEEINLLHRKFPNNIIQYDIYSGKEIIAGTTLFITNNVVHAQYISATDVGRKSGALDLLFYELITNHYKDEKYFSFGISNEHQGKTLNQGLTDWKEGFGSKVWVNSFYEIKTPF